MSDNASEKKWFVYLSDHHEGPFTPSEIAEKLAAKVVTPQSYVWMDGMADWKAMSEVAEFAAIIEATKAPAPTPTKSDLLTSPSAEENAKASMERSQLTQGTGSKKIQIISTEGPIDTSAVEFAQPAESPAMAAAHKIEKEEESRRLKRPRSRKTATLILILVALGGLGFALSQGYFDAYLKGGLAQSVRPLILTLHEKIPALGAWISPIPKLDDVDLADYEELKKGAVGNPGAPVAVGIAPSKADLLTPSLYVTAAVPDGTVIDVFVVGIGDTLLNQLEFSTKVTATIQQRLGKTNPISADGKPIPRGDYNIYAIESPQQPPEVEQALASLPVSSATLPDQLPKGKKVVGTKQAFLGGPKDDTYHQRLKAFHEKLVEKAQGELTEAKQFIAAISGQLNLTNSQFDSVRKRKGNALVLRKSWSPFHSQWQQFVQQLNQSFQRWTPEALQKEYFYGRLFSIIRDAGLAVIKVHEMQDQFFTQKTDPKAFLPKLNEATTQAQVAISAVQTQIEQIERTPASPGGLPKRLEQQ